MIRTVTFAAMLAACGLAGGVDSEPAKAATGDQVVLSMTGEVAKDYSRRCGTTPDNIASVETTATITSVTKDGRISFEHHGSIKRTGQPDTLVTLSGTAAPSALTVRVTPKETRIFSTPKAATYKVTNYETKTTVLALSELEGLTLRTWTLTEDTAK